MFGSIKPFVVKFGALLHVLKKKITISIIIAAVILGGTFFGGALSSLYEPGGGSSWVHMSIYKAKMILGLDKLTGIPGGLNITTARYEFETIQKVSKPGVWHLTTTDSKNILAIERSTGLLLLLTPENGSYKEKILSPSVFPKDAAGKPIINQDKTLANSKPPISMGVHYLNNKLLYSLVTQTKTNDKVCQKLSLYEVPLPTLDKEPTRLIERFTTPCSADKDNAVMWAGRIVHNEKKIFMSVGEQRYDRSGYPKTDIFSAEDLIWGKTVFGKILAFDPVTYKYEIYTSGHRNAQGLFWDFDHKQLLTTDHGPDGGDELNENIKGNNYGWPFVSFGRPYSLMFPSGKPIVNYGKNPSQGIDRTPERKGYLSGAHDGYAFPLHTWSPGTGIGNVIRIPMNSELKDWRGDIVVAMMGQNSIHRLKLNPAGAAVFDENIPAARFRDLMALPNGDLVFSLDKGELIIMRVKKF